MTRGNRRAHLVVWLVLAPAILVVVLLGLSLRSSPLIEPAPGGPGTQVRP